MANPKILIIDDEKLFIKSTQMVLEFYGFEIKGENCGETGLKTTESFKPDLILLDIMMPNMDGWQMLNMLKSNPYTQEIPLIVISAKDFSNDMDRVQSRGAVDFIQKPFKVEELVGKIKQHMVHADKE